MNRFALLEKPHIWKNSRLTFAYNSTVQLPCCLSANNYFKWTIIVFEYKGFIFSFQRSPVYKVGMAVINKWQKTWENKVAHAGESNSGQNIIPHGSIAISYLKKVWCSTQTFQSLLAARWSGSLKPIVLSNCSNCSGEKCVQLDSQFYQIYVSQLISRCVAVHYAVVWFSDHKLKQVLYGHFIKYQ